MADFDEYVDSLRYYGRKFRVLLRPEGAWLQGKVLGFRKTYSDESDEPKFTLIAEIEPADFCAQGVLVTRGGGRRDTLVVESMGKTIFTLLHPDGSRTENACICHYRLIGGNIELTIECMNVQGGGIATAPSLGLGDTMLSFEWLESARSKGYVDKTGAPTYEPASLKENQEQSRRMLLSQFMTLLQKQQKGGVQPPAKQLYLEMVQRHLGEPSPLMESLRCVPMVLLPQILVELVRDLGKADRDLVESMARVVNEVYHDKNWTSQCHQVIILYQCRPCESIGKQHAIEKTMWHSMWNVLCLLSQWYVGINDEETAFRYHQEALEWVQGAACLQEDDAKYYLSIMAHNLALGCVAVGDITAAFENLERALQLCPQGVGSGKDKHIREAHGLRRDAKDWIGTSGMLTPFETPLPETGDLLQERLAVDETFNVCRNCGRPDPSYTCGACAMTNYCGSQCQAVHWTTVHRHTCLFLPDKAVTRHETVVCEESPDKTASQPVLKDRTKKRVKRGRKHR